MKYSFPQLIATVVLGFLIPATAAGATLDERDEAVRWLLQARGMIRAGRLFEAMDKLHSSLALADQTYQHLTAALALANMAEIYRLYGDTAKAVSFYREALERYRAISNQSGIEGTQKKIDGIIGPTDQTVPAAKREKLIDQAIERARSRLQTRQASQSNPLEAVYTAYLESIKKAIVSFWTSPEVAIRSRKDGRVEVEFTILQDGRLDTVRVVETSEQASVDLAAIDAVKAAAPFPKIPGQLGIERLNVEFTFNYVIE